MKFSLLTLLMLVTIVALSIAIVSFWLTEDRRMHISASDSTYSWNLRESLLDKSPIWSTSDKNPPLAVRDAIDVTEEIINKLETASKPLGVGGWYLESLTLSPLDNTGFRNTTNRKWCYLVEFWGYRQPIHSGEPEIFSAIILMDGTVAIGEGNWRPKLDERMVKLIDSP